MLMKEIERYSTLTSWKTQRNNDVFSLQTDTQVKCNSYQHFSNFFVDIALALCYCWKQNTKINKMEQRT